VFRNFIKFDTLYMRERLRFSKTRIDPNAARVSVLNDHGCILPPLIGRRV
jgi:hypothetical protein